MESTSDEEPTTVVCCISSACCPYPTVIGRRSRKRENGGSLPFRQNGGVVPCEWTASYKRMGAAKREYKWLFRGIRKRKSINVVAMG
ncbi:hypothetical protein PO127_22010 [Bacteroides thetaiotaomicron]|uniref:Uncharacterized protein n=1 Tax=Bacteroides thetaiotaomicron TaxID=818 RepID=A0AAP3SH58_BACT4|nr:MULTISPECIES: hypothetical protein [Bacteroides]MCS2244213.1 hypothetical protein [Bacteroides thetaiotaomicron]MDC2219180.1 hypothetical protein [Bacteroides thetaiotaomicron]MDC2224874.1 hypothetical protein [Bacteroides thetaiotaomicron]MDC2238424.1 hypothetical protein [Bacteroides thetaiotaomicron]UVP54264.1 hypothetical protein NXX57_13370 [Bacteroides thetaiotaomicron]